MLLSFNQELCAGHPRHFQFRSTQLAIKCEFTFCSFSVKQLMVLYAHIPYVAYYYVALYMFSVFYLFLSLP
jgi:hypothetical protein